MPGMLQYPLWPVLLGGALSIDDGWSLIAQPASKAPNTSARTILPNVDIITVSLIRSGTKRPTRKTASQSFLFPRFDGAASIATERRAAGRLLGRSARE